MVVAWNHENHENHETHPPEGPKGVSWPHETKGGLRINSAAARRLAWFDG